MKNIHTFSGRMGNEMFRHAFLYAQVRNGVIPDWYLQDPKYFQKYSEEIKQLFGSGIGYLTQVGVHVRRGGNPLDPSEPKYSDNAFYVDLTKTDYYERAMAMFPGKKFLVFSDDPEWCQNKWGDNPDVQVMSKSDEVEDFNLLASCEHLIIANSSWSWWTAYLCPNEAKRIIAPKEWYSDGIERTKIPESWTRI